MNKQYLLFVALLLVGTIIVSSLEWRNSSSYSDQLAESKLDAEINSDQSYKKYDLADLSRGGVARRKPQKNKLEPARNGVSSFSGRDSSTQLASSTPAQIRQTNNSDKESGSYSLPSPSDQITPTPTTVPVQPIQPTQQGKVASKAKQQQQKANQTAQKDNRNDTSGNKKANEPQITSDQKEQSQTDTPPELNTNIQIAGSVVDTSGHLIQGLILSLKLTKASSENKTLFGGRELQAETDKAGRYHFLNLVEGDYQICTVPANGYRRACKTVHAPFLTADFTLTQTLNASVYGTVKDDSGVLLSDVVVSASSQPKRTKTNAEGQFDLSMSVDPNSTYQVSFIKNGYGRINLPVKGAEAQARKQLSVEMNVLSGTQVKGRVHDTSDRPIAGVSVRLHSPTVKPKSRLQGRSNNMGVFTINYVPTADDYGLSLSAPKYTFDRSQHQHIRVYDGMPDLDVTMQPIDLGVANLNATLRSPNGEAQSGVSLRLRSGSYYYDDETTNLVGQVNFTDILVKQGSGNQITISSSSTDPQFTFSGIMLPDGGYPTIDLLVSKGSNSLTLKVFDQQQPPQPINGASGSLIWTHKAAGITHRTSRKYGKTSQDKTGEINFSAMTSGIHQLEIKMPGYKTYKADIDIIQAGQYKTVELEKNP